MKRSQNLYRNSQRRWKATPKKSLLNLNYNSVNQRNSSKNEFFPKSEICPVLDAQVKLAQIIWGSCSSLDKASICPSKNHRKTRILLEPREDSTGTHELKREAAQAQKTNPRGQREGRASLPITKSQQKHHKYLRFLISFYHQNTRGGKPKD
jgi:hypothetical protein